MEWKGTFAVTHFVGKNLLYNIYFLLTKFSRISYSVFICSSGLKSCLAHISTQAPKTEKRNFKKIHSEKNSYIFTKKGFSCISANGTF